MSATTATLPTIPREDAPGITINTWEVGDADRQRAVADAIAGALEQYGLPDGMVSFTLFVGPDDRSICAYGQWAGEAAVDAFNEKHAPMLRTVAKEAGAEGDLSDPRKFQLYLNYVPGYESKPPEWMVGVTIEFSGEGFAAPWVDVTASEGKKVEPIAGLVANHFHISNDGRTMFNYTLWTEKQLHIEAIDSDSGPIGINGPVGQKVRTMPGVIFGGHIRYQLYRSLQAS